MAVKAAAPRSRRINQPSLDERLDQGRTARDRTRAQKNLAKAHTRDSERYVDQNEQDYEEFVKAVRSGRLEAAEGV